MRFEGGAARTFESMQARMIAHDANTKLFEATLAKAVPAGLFKGRLTAIIDSSPVNGARAVAKLRADPRVPMPGGPAAGDRLSGAARPPRTRFVAQAE